MKTLRPATIHYSALCLAIVLSAWNALHAQTGSSAAGTKYLGEGITALRAGDLASAQQAFERAVQDSPRSADAWTWKGIAESQATQYPAAVNDLQRAVSLAPTSVPAHYNLALNLIRLHQTDKAVAELQKVVELQPDALDPQYNLAVLLESKGDVAGAAAHFSLAHQLAPSDYRLTLRLLVALEKTGQAKDAQALLSEIAKSGDSGLITEAGTTLLETRQFAAAETLLQGQSSIPEGPEKTALLARIYIGESQYSKAVALLAAQPEMSKNAELLYLLGLAQTGTKQKAEAAHSFSAAEALRPEMAAPHYHLGILAAETPAGQERAAIELERAHSLEPEDPVYALAYARLLLERDQADKARAVLAQASDLTPEQAAEAKLMTGVALLSSGAIAEAQPLLQEAVAGAGGSLALAHNLLGFCLFHDGRYAEAASEYKVASDQQPKHRVFARDAAVAYSRANLYDAALLYADRAAALPDAGAIDLSLKARLELHMGRRQEAVQDLQRAISLDPQLDSAVYLLARTYQQLGDHAQALAWNAKLTALKQSKAEAYAKGKGSVQTGSTSALLQGSALIDESGVAP